MSAVTFGHQPQLPSNRLAIGPVGVSALTDDHALVSVQHALTQPGHLKLAFANSHLVNLAFEDPGLSGMLSCFLVLPDGIGVDLGARILYGQPFPANLNGTDFIPALLRSTVVPLRVGLLGARPGVADRAAEAMRRFAPQHGYTVCAHGFFAAEDEPQVLTRLEAERLDLLLVAFGNPRQEQWIAGRLDHRHARVAAGVGALFDFLAGEVPRAPAWVRRMRLEWAFRLMQEPSRLWRRYVVGNPRFLARIMVQKWRGVPRFP